MTSRACLVFGEALFDLFPDGSRRLGGAPLNLARHLHGLGVPTLFVGRVGRDPLGEEVRRRLRDWGMDDAGLQEDSSRATGTVEVRLDETGQPEFHVGEDQAWDAIDGDEAARTVRTVFPDAAPILYHGTLALRSEAGQRALSTLRRVTEARVFLDVNLRAPWWERSSVRGWLAKATWAKMNATELSQLADASGDEAAEARALIATCALDTLWVTRGAAGASAYPASGLAVTAPASAPDPLVDTVGAGDAFCAVAILGVLEGWGPLTVLRRAVDLATAMCGERGAMPDDPSLYARIRQRWSTENGEGEGR